MCGITGIFDLDGRRGINRNLLEAMNRSQAHRGPDGEGYHLEPGVGLGHRRLSIIDLEGGHQPLFNEDGSVAVTYNGEIYNFLEVRKELEAKGHVFKTRCDTEIIVHGWEEWGEACVERFNGMFAFGVWDRNRDCMFLGRDRIGIKPLYYAVTSDSFLIFATELKALMLHPGFDRTLSQQAIEDYFAFGYVPDPKTIFKRGNKLPPGHTLTVRRGQPVPQPRQYWDVEFSTDGPADPDLLDRELIERLSASIDRRLIAEVPLGAFLSGGVDSSAVVALMAQQDKEPVNTCSISFGDPAYNESRFAEQVARRYHTRHKVRQVDPADYSLLEALPRLYDEPFADSSAIPTYRVCELARESVTVALSGDGGDENFLGYRRYRWHAYEERVRRLLPQAIRGPVFGALGSVYPKIDWAPKILRAKSTLQALSRDSLEAYFRSVSIFPSELRQRLFSGDFTGELEGYHALEVFRNHAKGQHSLDPLQLVQYLDFKTYLPGDILTKVDRASMAHSLEVRVPLLEHQLVEWIATLPTSQKLAGREGKLCFKRALKPHLPHDIMYREKMGFAVPISSWFRKELAETLKATIRGDRLRDSGIFDVAFLERIMQEHQSGAREHSAILWALSMFDGFLATLESQPAGVRDLHRSA
ncbi:XrtA/PEP-CTERM system amidotransferase [Lentisalinibacter salinarum]|uniref:XrtA/PEP-CTERM system amidotransferase n=1 Tax=Lentisalinibacter salinarum TaxID=2992239 RepID=UPI00386D055D